MASVPNKPKEIIKRYIKKVEPFIKIKKVILFGSWAKGKAKRDSDLDIIIISPDFKRMDFMERLILLSKMRGEEFMSPGMDIFGYTREEFQKLIKESIVLEEAKQEGVVIK
jgi:predicted nucleotidyltransferase